MRTRLRCATRVLWLWLVIDPTTKLLPVLHLGPRTQDAAHSVIHSLRHILAPGCLPLFTSDGLNVHFYAPLGPFWRLAPGVSSRQERASIAGGGGSDLRPGEKKLLAAQAGAGHPRHALGAAFLIGNEKKNWFVEPYYFIFGLTFMLSPLRNSALGTQANLSVALQGMGFSGRLNTAFIERVNLTIRHGIAALARRTRATSQQAPHLLAHLEWWRAYSHFVRPHQSLRVRLVQPRERGGKRLARRYRQRTPAMAAGRTHRRWTAREVRTCPLPLERHASRMWWLCHGVEWWVKGSAEALGWRLTL